MRIATKFVAPLTDEKRLRLKETHKTDSNWRTRMRRNERNFRTAQAHLDKLRTACGAADHDFDLV